METGTFPFVTPTCPQNALPAWFIRFSPGLQVSSEQRRTHDEQRARFGFVRFRCSDHFLGGNSLSKGVNDNLRRRIVGFVRQVSVGLHGFVGRVLRCRGGFVRVPRIDAVEFVRIDGDGPVNVDFWLDSTGFVRHVLRHVPGSVLCGVRILVQAAPSPRLMTDA
jgi:hypothetical protein